MQPPLQPASSSGGTPAPGFGGPRSHLVERQGGQHALHAPTAQAKPSYAPSAGASGSWVHSPSSEPALDHTCSASRPPLRCTHFNRLCPVAVARAPQPCTLHGLVSLVASPPCKCASQGTHKGHVVGPAAAPPALSPLYSCMTMCLSVTLRAGAQPQCHPGQVTTQGTLFTMGAAA